MRAMLSATLIWLAAGASAAAQATATAASTAKPKQAATAPARPALQTPADTANAMAQAERLAIQSDLAWVGQYNGAITGDVSERMVAAIKEFQKDRGGKPTGVLNPAGAQRTCRHRAAAAGKCRLENRNRRRLRNAAWPADKTGAAAILRHQRRQMELLDRHHPDPAFAA